MTTTTGISCLKYLLFVLNLLLALLGLALTICGIWIKLNPEILDINSRLPITNINPVIYLAIAVGVFLFILGFFGCCGAYAENKCMICSYIIILTILLILQIVIAALAFKVASDSSLKEKMDKFLKEKFLYKYAKDPEISKFLDLVQHKLQCCGVISKDDYTAEDNENKIYIPSSCINDDTGSIFTKGCSEVIIEYFKAKATTVGGIAIGVFCIQIAVIIFAVCLYCGIRGNMNIV